MRKEKVHLVHFLFFSQNLFGSEMHQEGEKKNTKKKKQKTKIPSPVPAGGCTEIRTENRQQTGKMRISTIVAVVLSSGNWDCCPGIACHEPLAPKS